MRQSAETTRLVAAALLACTSLASCSGDSTAGPDVDVPPVVLQATAATTLEDTPVSLELGTNASVAGLEARVVSGPTNGVLSAISIEPGSAGASVSAEYTPGPDYFGADSVTIEVSDGLTDALATTTITITPVNDAPSFSIGADVVDSPGAGGHSIPGWATDIVAGPANEAEQSLTFSVDVDRPELFLDQPSISADGTLSYAPAAAGVGSALLNVTLKDGGGSENDGTDTSDLVQATVRLTFMAYVGSTSDPEIAVIDVEQGAQTRTINAGTPALFVAVSPDAETVAAASFSTDQVSVVSTSTGTVEATIPVGDGPGWVGFAPDGGALWVTHFGSGDVSVIDTETNLVKATVPVGNELRPSAFSPDGSTLWVPSRVDNTVTVLDVAAQTISGAPIPVGPNPRTMVLTPDGSRAYVPSLDADNVTVIDVSTRSVIGTIDVGRSPWEMAVSPDGSEVWVGNFGSDDVSVIDVATGTVSATIPLEILSAAAITGIAFTPDGRSVYVVVNGPNDEEVVFVVARESRAVVASIPLAEAPSSVAIGRVAR